MLSLALLLYGNIISTIIVPDYSFRTLEKSKRSLKKAENALFLLFGLRCRPVRTPVLVRLVTMVSHLISSIR